MVMTKATVALVCSIGHDLMVDPTPWIVRCTILSKCSIDSVTCRP